MPRYILFKDTEWAEYSLEATSVDPMGRDHLEYNGDLTFPSTDPQGLQHTKPLLSVDVICRSVLQGREGHLNPLMGVACQPHAINSALQYHTYLWVDSLCLTANNLSQAEALCLLKHYGNLVSMCQEEEKRIVFYSTLLLNLKDSQNRFQLHPCCSCRRKNIAQVPTGVQCPPVSNPVSYAI